MCSNRFIRGELCVWVRLGMCGRDRHCGSIALPVGQLAGTVGCVTAQESV